MTPIQTTPTVAMIRGHLELIDQTLLPGEYKILRLRRLDLVCEAICSLRVRGAPALGVAGAYGLLTAIEERWGDSDRWFLDAGVEREAEARVAEFPKNVPLAEIRDVLEKAATRIAATRPTAVNLGWALARMSRVWRAHDGTAIELLHTLLAEAEAIHREDLAMCRALGAHGAALVPDGASVLTHCNTGGLATSGYGTALGVVFAASESGKCVHVYADETRPLLQGARLTAWECERNGIPVTVLVDGAAPTLLASGKISCVIVGADRIAANGDSANKIGTLGLAIAASRFRVPFYVAAPSSTIDATLPDGSRIPIEQRAAEEVRAFAGTTATPEGVDVFNPAFDVTPADLIAAIITEKGIHRPPFAF